MLVVVQIFYLFLNHLSFQQVLIDKPQREMKKLDGSFSKYEKLNDDLLSKQIGGVYLNYGTTTDNSTCSQTGTSKEDPDPDKEPSDSIPPKPNPPASIYTLEPEPTLSTNLTNQDTTIN